VIHHQQKTIDVYHQVVDELITTTICFWMVVLYHGQYFVADRFITCMQPVSCLFPFPQFLGTFAELLKATCSFILLVHMEKLNAGGFY
jgi:hypothetical protein